MGIELTIAALALPLLLWLLWMKSDRITYQGAATALGPSVYVGPTGKNAFINLVLQNGDMLLGEIPVSRVNELKSLASVSVQVTQRQRLFAGARIAEITWPVGKDSDRVQNGEKTFEGLVLAAYYLLLGLFLMASPFPWAAALALAVSGLVCGNVTTAGSMLGRSRPTLAMYIPLGLMAVLCGVATVALFGTASVLMIFPGTVVAFATGQLLGMLLPRLS